MRRASLLSLAFLFTVTAWAADLVVVEDWAALKVGARGIPDGWKGGQTWGTPKHDFTIVDNSGRRVLHLKSQSDSSAVSKELKGIDLKQTPVLEWSWRVVTLPKGADCRSKYTDDQAAQLYVAWPRFPQAMRSRIIGYVWDTQAPQGLFVRSEKTGTVTYVVVRSGATDLGKWVTERRNVVDDYRKIYGEEPEGPGVVSIAIDSDDTSSSAEAFFGAIAFRKP